MDDFMQKWFEAICHDFGNTFIICIKKSNWAVIFNKKWIFIFFDQLSNHSIALWDRHETLLKWVIVTI